MKLRVVIVLGGAAFLAGCATVPKADAERAYISVEQSAPKPDGCDFSPERTKTEQWPEWGRTTRDFPPPRGSLRSSATYSYATQVGMERPAIGETRCVVIVREKSIFETEPSAEFAFQLKSINADTVEIRSRRAILRSSALWRTAASRVNVSVTFGLVDARARGRNAPAPDPALGTRPVAGVLAQTRADMGMIALGPIVEIDAQPVSLDWPETTPWMRVIAVVGERLTGRPDPSQRVMDRQVANVSVRYVDWPPAR